MVDLLAADEFAGAQVSELLLALLRGGDDRREGKDGQEGERGAGFHGDECIWGGLELRFPTLAAKTKTP
ncbi:MAG TPA: hypothetical protein VHD85_11755 [Terracidiphilus sp.]|nr:hypothetical protein [Terracidiphilus sp.]